MTLAGFIPATIQASPTMPFNPTQLFLCLCNSGDRFVRVVLIYMSRKRNYTAHFQVLLYVTLWQAAHWKAGVTEQAGGKL